MNVCDSFSKWLITLVSVMCICFFFLMKRRPPRSTRTDTLFPYTTLFLSVMVRGVAARAFQIPNPESPIPAPSKLRARSEEHTSELQSLMRISYAVFCLKKKKITHIITTTCIYSQTQQLQYILSTYALCTLKPIDNNITSYTYNHNSR